VAERNESVERDETLRIAAEWSVELSAAQISPRRIDEWQQWLTESDAHRDAFDQVQSTLRAIDRAGVDDLPWPSEAELAGDVYDGSISVSAWRARSARIGSERRGARAAWRDAWRRYRRDMTLGLVASIVTVLAIPVTMTIVRTMQMRPSVTVAETSAGETRDVSLDDGSTVTLGARSMISVRLGLHAREVTLDSGEAFFRVAKDPQRPFVVRVGQTTVAAIGTAFNIRRAAERVVVAVADGIVRVDAPATLATAPAHAELGVGQQLSIDTTDGSSTMQVVDAGSIAVWRDGLLQYRDEPLPSVIADVSRYYSHDIVIADRDVEKLRVTGTVFADDVESWLLSLEAALPIRAIRTADGAVHLESMLRK
jgi:transmembrane sensor